MHILCISYAYPMHIHAYPMHLVSISHAYPTQFLYIPIAYPMHILCKSYAKGTRKAPGMSGNRGNTGFSLKMMVPEGPKPWIQRTAFFFGAKPSNFWFAAIPQKGRQNDSFDIRHGITSGMMFLVVIHIRDIEYIIWQRWADN